MKKGFIEILTESFSVLKQSFLSLLCLYIGMLVLVVASGIVSALLLGRQATLLPMMMRSGNVDPSMLSQFSPQSIIIYIIMSFFVIASFYFIGMWSMLIIRNNALIGQSLWKQSFFETLRKIPKLILLGILFIIFYVISASILSLIHKALFVIFMFLCLPLLYTISFGVIYKEGKFFENFEEGFFLGISEWFRIIGYIILLGFIMTVLLIAVIFVASLVKTSVIAVVLFCVVLQFFITLFSYCFYTVFYLDLAEIRPQIIEEIDISTESETPTL